MTTSQQNSASVKATSTVKSAFSDPFNLFMIVPFSLLSPLCLLLTILPTRNIAVFIGFVFTTVWVIVYVRAVTHREFEVSPSDIHFREASIRVHFPWKEIEAIKIERWKKQITIWSNGKFRRIHEFGLPAVELEHVRKALDEQIDNYHIQRR